MKIKSVQIGPYPHGYTDPMPSVVATLEDGSVVELFSFYPDELNFHELEFVGLTIDQGRRLKFEKDQAWLRRP